jgi:hypothetical protein
MVGRASIQVGEIESATCFLEEKEGMGTVKGKEGKGGFTTGLAIMGLQERY